MRYLRDLLSWRRWRRTLTDEQRPRTRWRPPTFKERKRAMAVIYEFERKLEKGT